MKFKFMYDAFRFINPKDWRNVLIESSISCKRVFTFDGKSYANVYQRIFIGTIFGAALLAVCSVYASETVSIDTKIFFNIPRERADFAIVKFAEQSNMTYIFPFDEARKIVANRVYGRYTREEAVKILLQGTRLQPEIASDGSLKIMTVDRIKKKGEDMTLKRQSVIAGIVAAIGLQVNPALAQSEAQLEEIIVTAQRRVQSLQEVPISIEAISGSEIQKQGYRNLDDLANFSPSVYVDDSLAISQERSIRGFGTSGFAATLEQAVPMFVDGVHYGRASQVKTAFLDIERVEILKGPQPVYFGLNATAGAFSIESRKPTPELDGYIDAEYGNNNASQVEGAIGGPITDTFGFRVAGKYDSSNGFLRDVITGAKLPEYKQLGGRLTLAWNPTESFNATLKYDISRIDKGVEGAHICLVEGSLIYPRNGEGIAVGDAPPGTLGPGTSVFADPPKGSGWDVPFEPLGDCFESEQALSAGAPYFEPPINIRNDDDGIIDVREARDYHLRNIVGTGLGGNGGEVIDTDTAMLNVTYEFSNGISATWITAHNEYFREYNRDNGRDPFNVNNQYRQEDFDQWSSELRLSSPAEGVILGDNSLEWMIGGTWQITDNDIINNAGVASVFRSMRFNETWEDQEWQSVFAAFTFNMFDDKLSLDAGARYTHVSKDGYIRGWASQWVFDITPCNDPNDDPDTCALHPRAVMINPSDTQFILPGADTSNLWILEYQRSRSVPPDWHTEAAIGLSAKDYEVRAAREGGPYLENLSEKHVDPQVTLRYRPTENHSIFARWAQAFKAGGFDTGTNAINPTVEEFIFGTEYSETYELGSKGTFFDGQVRYDVTLFNTKFTDFQVAVTTGNELDPYANVNAGGQRVRGAEFSVASYLTEQFLLGFSGALMDGKFTFFPNAGCTPDELARFEQTGCDPDTGLIDRTGTEPARTPDWKFVLSADYWMPVLDNHKLAFNAKGYISDGFIIDVNGYSRVIKYNKHEDLNLSISFGDMNDRWSITAFGRNILEARPSYNPEFDIRPAGFQWQSLSSSSFFSYGIKFRYSLR